MVVKMVSYIMGGKQAKGRDWKGQLFKLFYKSQLIELGFINKQGKL